MFKRLVYTAGFVAALSGAPVLSSFAADGGHVSLPSQSWSFDGPLGTYDKASLQRGFKIYKNVCSACHSMNHLSYRHLEKIGLSPEQVKAVAAEYTVQDGPNDEGEMFERPARPSDTFKNPYNNVAEAKYANNGALPPDMSLLVRARQGGADYIYGILIGYEQSPEGHDLLPGQHWNRYMPGHVIAMAPPLSNGVVPYDDGSPETLDQYARDVAQFLTWASSPDLDDRKMMGVKAVLFLMALAGVLYAVKRKVWANAH